MCTGTLHVLTDLRVNFAARPCHSLNEPLLVLVGHSTAQIVNTMYSLTFESILPPDPVKTSMNLFLSLSDIVQYKLCTQCTHWPLSQFCRQTLSQYQWTSFVLTGHTVHFVYTMCSLTFESILPPYLWTSSCPRQTYCTNCVHNVLTDIWVNCATWSCHSLDEPLLVLVGHITAQNVCTMYSLTFESILPPDPVTALMNLFLSS
jgi:hypothetical protein